MVHLLHDNLLTAGRSPSGGSSIWITRFASTAGSLKPNSLFAYLFLPLARQKESQGRRQSPSQCPSDSETWRTLAECPGFHTQPVSTTLHALRFHRNPHRLTYPRLVRCNFPRCCPSGTHFKARPSASRKHHHVDAHPPFSTSRDTTLEERGKWTGRTGPSIKELWQLHHHAIPAGDISGKGPHAT